jgi:hypothetical protein
MSSLPEAVGKGVLRLVAKPVLTVFLGIYYDRGVACVDEDFG